MGMCEQVLSCDHLVSLAGCQGDVERAGFGVDDGMELGRKEPSKPQIVDASDSTEASSACGRPGAHPTGRAQALRERSEWMPAEARGSHGRVCAAVDFRSRRRRPGASPRSRAPLSPIAPFPHGEFVTAPSSRTARRPTLLRPSRPKKRRWSRPATRPCWRFGCGARQARPCTGR